MKQIIMDSKAARILSWVVAFVLSLLPFHALLTTWAGSNFGHSSLFRVWKEILIILCLPLVLWLVLHHKRLKDWLAHSWLIRLIGLYTLMELVWGAWALHVHNVNKTALFYGLDINLRFLGFLIVALVAGATSTLIARNWVKILLWPAAIVVAFGLLQHYILPDDFLRHFGYGPNTIEPYQTVDANSRYIRIQSSLRGPNPLGAYLVMIMPAILLSLRRRIIVCGLFAIATAIVLFYSYSRSAWIGTAIAVGLVCWLSLQRLPRWVPLAVIALVVIIFGSLYGLRENQSVEDIFFHTSKSSLSPHSSNVVRDTAIRDAAREVWHQPLGAGPGTAGPASFHNDHPARIAEDYYLQVAQEVGIPGLIVFLGILALTAWQLWLRRADMLASVLLASLAGICFVNLVSHAWADDTLSLLWWGLAGIALAPAILKTNNHNKNEKAQQKPT
jgi:O-antigen ligase